MFSYDKPVSSDDKLYYDAMIRIWECSWLWIVLTWIMTTLCSPCESVNVYGYMIV